MAQRSNCPPDMELERLLFGQAPQADVEALESHFAECERCLRTARDLQPRDTLLASLLHKPGVAGDFDAAVEPDLLERLCRLRWAGATERLGEATGGWLPAPAAPEAIGCVGPYRLLDLLGSGGMGAVYKARDARLKRVVALKMILAGPRADRERLVRFRREAELVSRLRHANIVQIFDIGEHEGRPYYTMELIEGGSLAGRLARGPLASRAAAELIELLARAVNHAHENGVLHRDLKPANVLLQPLGGGGPKWPSDPGPSILDCRPLITDFGLAKPLLDEQKLSADQYDTESGAILGTPGYMAPEQATGGRQGVGPAADVYALGAILYEALTGRPPFRAATALETLDQVRSQEPVPVLRLQPSVPRDIETICLKCLAKDPRRRYASAVDLAADVRRFLTGEPIQARPVSARERLLKWTRRKPALAALIAVCAIMLAGAASGVLVYNARLRAAAGEARRQQRRADEHYRSARETLNHMLRRLESRRLGELPQLKDLERELMQDALEFYLKALEDQQNPDPKVRFDTAVACRRAADIQQRLGQADAAKSNYRRVLELIEGLPAEDRNSRESRFLAGGCYNNLGLLANNTAQWDEAERYHQRALGVYQKFVGSRPDPDRDAGIAESEHNLAVIYQLDNRPDDAVRRYEHCIKIRTALVRHRPRDERYQAALADDHINLGLLHQNHHRLEKVTGHYEQAEKLLQPLAAAHPPGGEFALSLSALYLNWAYFLVGTGHAEEGLAKNTKAVELAERVFRLEPRHYIAGRRVFTSHGGRAQTYEALGRFADAIPDWDRVVELDESPDRWRHRVLRALAMARAGQHQRAAAEDLSDLTNVPGEGYYNLACAFALSVKPAELDAGLPADERERLTVRYRSQAIALLKKLAAQGYFKNAANASSLAGDEDLSSLRGQAEFQRLLDDVAAGKQDRSRGSGRTDLDPACR